MKKRLVSILLVLVMVLGMLPTVAFEAETAASITTAEEFAAMDAGGNYILDTDITITKPHSGDFQGHFDGNGHHYAKRHDQQPVWHCERSVDH